MLPQVGIYRLGSLEFPGRAGQLRRSSSTAALVRELGDNYEVYHGFLAEELAKFGGRPTAKEYPARKDYDAAWTRIQELVIAEAFLRNCVAYRRDGRPLESLVDTSIALIDKDDRLVDAFPAAAQGVTSG